MVIQSLGRGSNGYKEAFGELGTGLGALAGTLVSAKLGSVARKHQEDAQTDAYVASGIPPAQARALARADAFTQQSVLQEHISRGGLGNAPQQQDQFAQQPQMQQGAMPQLAALQALRGTPQFQQQAQPSQYQNVMSSIGAPGQGPAAAQQGLQNLSTAGALQMLQGPKAMAPIGEQGLKNLLKSQQAQQLPQQQVPQAQQAPVAQAPIQAAPIVPTAVQPRIAPARQALINDAFSGGPGAASAWADLMRQPTKKELAERRKEDLLERKQRHAEEKTSLAETKEYYDKTLTESKAAESDEHILDRMIKLEEKGSLPWTASYNLWKDMSENNIKTHIPFIGDLVDVMASTLVKKVGDIGSGLQRRITATDTEEYEKLSASFLKNIGTYFKGSISNNEIEQFLKTIPTLSQTAAGRQSIERNMKSAIQLKKQEAKIMKDIIRENGNKRPVDLAFQVEERMEPYKEEFANQFRQGVAVQL